LYRSAREDTMLPSSSGFAWEVFAILALRWGS
jgi:hypothetical protein